MPAGPIPGVAAPRQKAPWRPEGHTIPIVPDSPDFPVPPRSRSQRFPAPLYRPTRGWQRAAKPDSSMGQARWVDGSARAEKRLRKSRWCGAPPWLSSRSAAPALLESMAGHQGAPCRFQSEPFLLARGPAEKTHTRQTEPLFAQGSPGFVWQELRRECFSEFENGRPVRNPPPARTPRRRAGQGPGKDRLRSFGDLRPPRCAVGSRR